VWTIGGIVSAVFGERRLSTFDHEIGIVVSHRDHQISPKETNNCNSNGWPTSENIKDDGRKAIRRGGFFACEGSSFGVTVCGREW
jgi:hypothetical protein